MMDNKKSSCSIALMSGKGGSGKTTLALSMASLLSSSGIKTLLVDCDLSTNGATYFFEDEMAYSVNEIDTLQELMANYKGVMDIKTYNVNQYFDFLPSVTIIGDYYNPDILANEARLYLEDLFSSFLHEYEVIIFDCQAGYTQLLEIIIGVVDRNLMVLEADSVSASAVRNLFLKLNKAWNRTKVYQVFNKATKEEAEIYSKVTFESTFDNIGCILFDWTVRRAFSTSQIPDMDHTSSSYGYQISELCNALIRHPNINQKLNYYIDKRKVKELTEVENKAKSITKELMEEKDSLELSMKDNSKSRFRNIFLDIMPVFFFLFATMIIVIITTDNFSIMGFRLDTIPVKSLIIGICTFFITLYSRFSLYSLKNKDHSDIENMIKIRRLNDQIDKAIKEQVDSQKQINQLEEKINLFERMHIKDDDSHLAENSD